MERMSHKASAGVEAVADGRGFLPLLAVRGLTLVNDHALKWLAIGLGKRLVEEGRASLVLTIGLVGLSLPYVLFSWLAGSLADRRSKTVVVRWCKVAEVAIAAAATAVVALGMGQGSGWLGLPLGLWLLLAAVMAIGLQAAIMTPSIVGAIPELVPSSRLASANGLFALVSLVAVLAGTAAGNWVADATPLSAAATAVARGFPAGSLLLGTALAGVVAAASLPRLAAAAPDAPPAWNALARTWTDLRVLVRQPELAAAAAGIVFFWAIGAVAQANVDQYADEAGATSQGQVVPLLVALVAGIGAGSVVTGKLATRPAGADPRVDLGFVPLGGVIMTVAFLALSAIGGRFVEAGGVAAWIPLVWLVVLGFGAGMFDVPLETYLQEKSPPDRLGGVLAATNLLLFGGMFLASLAYGGLRAPSGPAGAPLLSARAIFALFALLSLGAVAVAVWCAPRATLRLFVATIVHAGWRFRVRGTDNLPAAGPVVVAGNHLSWLDGFLLPLASPRPLRMVVYGPNIRGRFLRMLADQWRFILFEPSPKSIARALKTLQSGLAAGDAVGIFPEGGISRTGQLLGFKRGLDWVLERIAAPIVPAHVDGMWGSTLSHSEGRFFSKWPRPAGGRRRAITLWFGDPLPPGTPPRTARIALQELSARAVRERSLDERDAERDLAAWSRRFRRGSSAVDVINAGHPLDARGEAVPGPADRGRGRAIVVGEGGLRLDWGTLAATAEAFDGCCQVRRDDRLVSSLAPGDPLFAHLGLLGGPLLGIDASSVAPDAGGVSILRQVAARGATLWLAPVGQVAAAAREGAVEGALPQVVVMPIAAAGELRAARAAAAAFLAAHGVEPVVAFAPGPLGGLVAMNTPPSRSAAHETTCRGDSLGRVVNGVAVWADAADRSRAGLRTLPEALRNDPVPPPAPAAGGPGIVVAATAPRRGDDPATLREAVWFTLGDAVTVDGEGFLVPDGMGDGGSPGSADSRPGGGGSAGRDDGELG